MPGGTTGPNAMDEKTLKRLLRAEGTEAERPGRRCPDEALLSAYADHRIPDDKRATLEAHLADCEACLGQVAFLARRPAEDAAPVMPGAMARARDFVAPAPKRWRQLVLRWGATAACMASVVLVVIAVLRPGATPQAPTAKPGLPAASASPAQAAPEPVAAPSVAAPQVARRPSQAVPSPPTVRNSAPSANALSVVAPPENATLSRKDLEFRWQGVQGSLYYEISLMTDEGTVVWQGRADGTSARLPDGQRLEAGARYFVRVRAHLAGGETIKSAAVSFHLKGR